MGAKALLYFEIVTTIALLAGILIAWLIQPGKGINTAMLQGADMSPYTNGAASFTWLHFFKDNLTIQVLVFSIVFGIFLSKYKRREAIMQPLGIASKYVFKALNFVMLLAPVGAFGGMAYTIDRLHLIINIYEV